ncbi:MAG: hypothetical protein Q9Q40_14525 [Acidobacteriota bacterium]|nr:hypothetical protein [Acidobacteriota bacterium]
MYGDANLDNHEKPHRLIFAGPLKHAAEALRAMWREDALRLTGAHDTNVIVDGALEGIKDSAITMVRAVTRIAYNPNNLFGTWDDTLTDIMGFMQMAMTDVIEGSPTVPADWTEFHRATEAYAHKISLFLCSCLEQTQSGYLNPQMTAAFNDMMSKYRKCLHRYNIADIVQKVKPSGARGGGGGGGRAGTRPPRGHQQDRDQRDDKKQPTQQPERSRSPSENGSDSDSNSKRRRGKAGSGTRSTRSRSNTRGGGGLRPL